ncbi:MAG: hypothetical protein JXR77_17260 [Lentisphaeria bacterium]|nr:hypothetical protein [Lentisphaeria bacterium]
MGRGGTTRRGRPGLRCGALVLLVSAWSWAQAPAAPAEAAQPEGVAKGEDGMLRVQVGEYTVEGRCPWLRADRFADRSVDVWQWYMHGIVDSFATPLSWEQLLSEGQLEGDWLDGDVLLRGCPYRASLMPSLRLDAGEGLLCGKALLGEDSLGELAGKTVRVFVWLSAEDTGQGGSLWSSAPRMDVFLVGLAGIAAFPYRGAMATRGSFPWHCYYRDVELPAAGDLTEDAYSEVLKDGIKRSRGLYLRLENPVSGRAWFSVPSWEVVEKGTEATAERIQDPITGSAAPHSRLDELPVHLCSAKVMHHGLVPGYAWQFLAGARGGAPNVPPVLTREGFDTYLAGVARQDAHHMLNGLARLPEWYHAGTRFGLLPEHDEGWLAHVAEAMQAAQDAETGYWGTLAFPRSMAMTAAVVERMFGADAIVRSDREAVKLPWLSCGAAGIPRADAIVESVLRMQVTLPDSRRSKGAWSRVAGNGVREQDLALDSACSLAATADAVYLLRRCAASMPPATRTRIDRAVREAMAHVWQSCLQPNGLWKQVETDPGPRDAGSMGRLLDASPLLEHRVNPVVPPPEIAEIPPVRKGRIVIRWLKPADAAVALRVYVAPVGTDPGSLREDSLAAIIQKSDGDVRTMDPVAAALAMRKAARDPWGTTWSAGTGGYTEWKLGLLPRRLPIALDSGPVTLTLAKPRESHVFVCSVNGYGELSRAVPVPIAVAPEEEAEETVEENAEATEPTPAEDGKAGEAEGGGTW